MKRYAAVAAIAVAAFAFPTAAAEIQIASAGPVVELTVSDNVNAKPDAATVSAGVTTRAMGANEAARLNAVRMDQIINRLKQLGVAASDIQTNSFSLNPLYSYNNSNEGRQPTFLGYDVNNQVTVKLRDIAKIGPALDALVAAGANSFSGPNFVLDNDTAARTQARKNAFTSAEARARELAGYAGFKSVRLLELSEVYQTMGGGYFRGESAVNVSSVSSQTATPIQPGLVGISAQLTVKYEMIR
ncbi:SIMPL domain-containing protein [Novosphingobium sp.]|uniref:SIMPL domain-containing protein n=1 Tax=Novosphingobium sp. TaxID=1874826 RepID=UPI0025E8740E|nr:SIMPL domain-containing protein [Novosphingobium sp.]